VLPDAGAQYEYVLTECIRPVGSASFWYMILVAGTRRRAPVHGIGSFGLETLGRWAARVAGT